MSGKAGSLSWDITFDEAQSALYTFPRWTWEREVLPGAQIVNLPGSKCRGTLNVGDQAITVDGEGSVAHIFSHGSANRWSWLHADLGGGDLLEIVAAEPHLPGKLSVAPRPFVRLRCDGVESPRVPIVSALTGSASATLPAWHTTALLDFGTRLKVEASLEPEHSVQLQYPHPDGSSFAYCTNSERASARVVVERLGVGGWSTEREWNLDGTAHAEVGSGTPWLEVPCLDFVGIDG